MKSTAAKYFFFTGRFISLVVYAAFFIVHLLYLPGLGIAAMIPVVSGTYSIKAEKSISNAGETGEVKKVKLNISKRFQQAAGLPEFHEAEILLPVYNDTTCAGKPHRYLLISHILVSSLRGPPAQA